ncbi:hypothetical protein PSAB6_10401 [Paraburkholderia sabiae]|nr:hypothetical protein PSAB6_10401 [Paraburkholderia sabiae]
MTVEVERPMFLSLFHNVPITFRMTLPNKHALNRLKASHWQRSLNTHPAISADRRCRRYSTD